MSAIDNARAALAFYEGHPDSPAGHLASALTELITEHERFERTSAADITAELRAARAETWDEAISAVFAWWSAPEDVRPGAIVNPYGVGLTDQADGDRR